MRFLAVLTLVLGSCLPTLGQTKIPVADLKEDFSRMREKLTRYNAGLYEFIDKEALNAHWDSLENSLTEPLTDREFSLIIVKALQPVKERHLSYSFHKKSEYQQHITDHKTLFLPLFVHITHEDEAYILRNASADSTVELGAKLLAINDKPINEIQQEIFDHIIVDQSVNTWKYFETNTRFHRFYHQFIDTTSTFKVQYIDSLGANHTKTLKGVNSKVLGDSVTTQTKRLYKIDTTKPAKPQKALTTKFYDSLSTAKVRVRTFNKKRLKAGEARFKKDIKNFFEEIEEKNIQNLIIDVRGNTGGRITYLAYLLSYIKKTEERPEMLKRTYYRWLQPMKTRTTDEKVPKTAKNAFNGNVYILTDGGSYSAAVMMAAFGRKFADAKIAGIPTGGRHNGTTAGSFKLVKLKNSNLIVRIPLTLFHYNVDETNSGSLIVDHYLLRDVQDYFGETDSQVQQLLEVIKQNATAE